MMYTFTMYRDSEIVDRRHRECGTETEAQAFVRYFAAQHGGNDIYCTVRAHKTHAEESIEMALDLIRERTLSV